jgi:hypothetical protein
VSCYLCAYRFAHTPKTPDQGTSIAPPPDPLGTCWRCYVLACSAHGARVGQFTCAICEGAEATQFAIAPTSVPQTALAGASVSHARSVGEEAPAELKETIDKALRTIVEDSGAGLSHDDRMWLATPRAGQPNLVTNLAESIRDLAGAEMDAVAETRDAPQPGVSIDAIGAVVRELFADHQIVVTEGSVATVTGALLLAVDVAHDASSPVEAATTPPWDLAYPVLLDPVMWMVSTAVQQVSMGRAMGAGSS